MADTIELEPFEETTTPHRIPRSATLNLYTSHFLSTWNSRLFEFGSTLFLASIYPDTLLPLSIYALSRSAAAIVFAQAIGGWIDGGSRITVVQTSIVGQRITVIASCIVFWALEGLEGGEWRGALGRGLFGVLVVLACVEKLCAVGNLVAVERDWVVVITEGNQSARRILNARLRRIDLICKLVGPLTISLIAIPSTLIAIWATLGMSAVSVGIEYICIRKVYNRFPALIRIPSLPTPTHLRPRLQTWTLSILPLKSLPTYLRHPACLPSLALSLLYLTVLSLSGQMVTYLLAIGFTPLYIGIARTVSTLLEVSATWFAPRLAARIGPVRTGIWSLSWQMFFLALGVSAYLGESEANGTKSFIAGVCLAVGVAVSRIGLWGYDLSAQNIIQDSVDSSHRGAFSTVEAAFQNLFELLSYVTTIIFSRPQDFRWPVIISLMATYSAGGIYTVFVRRTRGHLLHASDCVKPRRGAVDEDDEG